MLPSAILSLILLGIAGFLIDAHRRKWRAVSADPKITESNLRYARSEYRRRMKASSGIGVVGCLIAISPIVPRHPVWLTIYVAILMLTTITILLFAVVDIWASSQRYHRLRTAQEIVQARLAHELEQRKKEQESSDPLPNNAPHSKSKSKS